MREQPQPQPHEESSRADASNTNVDADLAAEVRDFIASRKLLNLASLTPDGHPHASTAPFLAADGYFYLFISDLSEHAANLKGHRKASVIFNADEADTKQAFARLRVTFDVEAAIIDRAIPLWQKRIDQLREKFGPVIDQLKNLRDFHLFELKPSAGRYVKGFGQAYALDGLEKQIALHPVDGNREKDGSATSSQ